MNHLVSSPQTQHGRQTQEPDREPVQSGFEIFWIVCVGLVVTALVIYFLSYRKNALLKVQHAEWQHIKSALFVYQAWFGEMPPAADPQSIRSHYDRCYHRSEQSFDAFVASLPHRLEDLDEREAVLFWLDGTSTRAAGWDRPVLIQPDSKKIVDVDGDGWPELVDCMGNVFLLRAGQLYVLDPQTNQVIPATVMVSDNTGTN